MKDKILAKRYSIAFFKNISREQFGQLLHDVEFLRKFVSEYPSVITLLHSPITDNEQKENIAKEISEILTFTDRWDHFFKLLIKKNRISIFSMILEELENITYRAMDKIRVKIIFAQNESETIIKKIEAKVANIIGKAVVSETFVNPAIIGGFIAQTESLRIDGSIKGNLVRLQKLIQE